MRRSRPKPSKTSGKAHGGPRVSTSRHSLARAVSPEEPTSPNPRPSKIARRHGRNASPSGSSGSRRTGMARFEDMLAGSTIAHASREANTGRISSASAGRRRVTASSIGTQSNVGYIPLCKCPLLVTLIIPTRVIHTLSTRFLLFHTVWWMYVIVQFSDAHADTDICRTRALITRSRRHQCSASLLRFTPLPIRLT